MQKHAMFRSSQGRTASHIMSVCFVSIVTSQLTDFDEAWHKCHKVTNDWTLEALMLFAQEE